jgi:hypothetical protein
VDVWEEYYVCMYKKLLSYILLRESNFNEERIEDFQPYTIDHKAQTWFKIFDSTNLSWCCPYQFCLLLPICMGNVSCHFQYSKLNWPNAFIWFVQENKIEWHEINKFYLPIYFAVNTFIENSMNAVQISQKVVDGL